MLISPVPSLSHDHRHTKFANRHNAQEDRSEDLLFNWKLAKIMILERHTSQHIRTAYFFRIKSWIWIQWQLYIFPPSEYELSYSHNMNMKEKNQPAAVKKQFMWSFYGTAKVTEHWKLHTFPMKCLRLTWL